MLATDKTKVNEMQTRRLLLNNYVMHTFAQNSGIYDMQIADTLNAVTLSSVKNIEQHMMLVRECILRVDSDEEYASLQRENISRIIVGAAEALCKRQLCLYKAFCKNKSKEKSENDGEKKKQFHQICQTCRIKSTENMTNVDLMMQTVSCLCRQHEVIGYTVSQYIMGQLKRCFAYKIKPLSNASGGLGLDDEDEEGLVDMTDIN